MPRRPRLVDFPYGVGGQGWCRGARRSLSLLAAAHPGFRPLVWLLRPCFLSGTVGEAWLKRVLPGSKQPCPSSPIPVRVRGFAGMVPAGMIIGVDPHKASVTIEVIDGRWEGRCDRSVRTDRGLLNPAEVCAAAAAPGAGGRGRRGRGPAVAGRREDGAGGSQRDHHVAGRASRPRAAAALSPAPGPTTEAADDDPAGSRRVRAPAPACRGRRCPRPATSSWCRWRRSGR